MRKLSAFSHLIFLYFIANVSNGDGFDPVIKLPQFQSLKKQVKSRRVVSVHHFGAKGDGIYNDTQAFKDAWEIACSSPLRFTIEVPSGSSFLVGPIEFVGPCRSKVTLRVTGNIIAPKDPGAWDGLNPRKWLYFTAVKHLTIDGGGVIIGMGEEWWSRSCKVNISNPCRHAPTVSATSYSEQVHGSFSYVSVTHYLSLVLLSLIESLLVPYVQAVTFHRCKDLKISNVMTLNSQQMHMAFTNCVRVKASLLKVIAPVDSPNTDGIHISASSKVEVTNSIIKTGDDCISIVSNSSQIQIRNISCMAGHGISIGSLGKSNSWSAVNDVSVDGALLANTKNGMRIKTWQGGSGFSRTISFRNVLMENVSNPIIIDQYYCDSFLPCSNQTSAVKVEDISFVNITGTSATEEAIRFACSDTYPCEEIYVENIQLSSYLGGYTTSFCWNVKGSSWGVVYPPSCLSCSKSFIELKTLPSNGHLSF
ncbi:hypothetical protein IFM89_006316 [Coptis chinensis]|uniref:Polygalacturonase n=1 Tax=Coptis chinensis TaxID=261450 RepID=A0A835I7Y5_9MAGN|nr:hypothetical protein IFM89_006316 [Coptis chinensis]